jgi:hypothetical protein
VVFLRYDNQRRGIVDPQLLRAATLADQRSQGVGTILNGQTCFDLLSCFGISETAWIKPIFLMSVSETPKFFQQPGETEHEKTGDLPRFFYNWQNF